MNTKELLKTIKHLEISSSRKANEVFVGNYKSAFRGQGLEVSDLRKYEEGDDARNIDWLVTAKQGEPYVKKFQETRELSTMLLVDVSVSMKFSTSQKLKSQVALETLAIILFSALKNNDKFGVIIFADKIYNYIPPRKGRAHLFRILRAVLRANEKSINKPAKIFLAIDLINKTLKNGSICFLLTDSLEKLVNNSATSLKVANKKFDFIYIRIFDIWERVIDLQKFHINMLNPENGQSAMINLHNKKIITKYNKIRQLKITIENDLLKKNNIDFLDIATDDNIYKVLLLFFKKRTLKP